MIKDGKRIFLLVMLILALVLAGCSSDGGSENAQQLSATPANFDEVFNSVKAKPGNYVINLTGDLTDYPGNSISTAGVNITVKGTGSNKITWKFVEGKPPLFHVTAGKLTLENINLSRAAGNTKDWPLTSIAGGTIEMKNGVVLSTNINSTVGVQSGAFIMSGGTIEDCQYNGVWLGGGAFTMSGGTIEKGGVAAEKGVSITMKGGTIRNNNGPGIGIWGGENSVVTISGGTISGNGGNSVFIGGTGTKLTISGGNISGNADTGIQVGGGAKSCSVTISGGTVSGNGHTGIFLDDNSENCTATISGGTISGNKDDGVVLTGKNNKLTMTSGTISDNGSIGVVLNGTGSTFTMSGGAIEKNVGYGLRLDGADLGFEKKKGAVIYGNSGDNKNGDGAIRVKCAKDDSKSLALKADAGKDDVYAAKINAGQTDITGKQGPNW